MNVKRIILCTIIFMVAIISLSMASAGWFDFGNDYVDFEIDNSDYEINNSDFEIDNNNEHYEAYAEVSADNINFSVVDYDPGTANEFFVTREDDQYYYGNAVNGYEAEGNYSIKFQANLSNLDWEIKPCDGYNDTDLNKTSIKNFLNDYFKNNFADNNDEGGYWNWSTSPIGRDILGYSCILENGILSVNEKFEDEGSVDYTDSISIYLNNDDDDAHVMISVKWPEETFDPAYNLPNNHGDDAHVNYNLHF